MKPLPVALLSDVTGETADLVLRAALSQFPGLKGQVLFFRRLRTGADLCRAVENCQAQGVKLILSTLAGRGAKDELAREADKAAIPVVHLLQPLVERIGELTGEQPIETPGAQRKINASYFRRIRAMEFTIACDDGRSPQLLSQADLVIYGVSRAGKTPLSLFLAGKGVAVANVPLLPGIPPDPRALEVPPEKRVGLLIAPQRLREIRLQRLALMGLDPEKASYAKTEAIEAELAEARGLMEELGCRIYESTDEPIESLGYEILSDYGFTDWSFE